MTRKKKFVAGAVVLLAAIGYLVYAGVSQSVVYFVTPSELAAGRSPARPIGWAGSSSRAASSGSRGPSI